MLVRVSKALSLNTQHVVAVGWDRRHYMNGPGPSTLVVTMVDGTVHRIEHQPQYLDGTDAYAAEKALVAPPELVKLLGAAVMALRSYQYGNAAPGLAEEVADAGEALLSGIGFPVGFLAMKGQG